MGMTSALYSSYTYQGSHNNLSI